MATNAKLLEALESLEITVVIPNESINLVLDRFDRSTDQTAFRSLTEHLFLAGHVERTNPHINFAGKSGDLSPTPTPSTEMAYISSLVTALKNENLEACVLTSSLNPNIGLFRDTYPTVLTERWVMSRSRSDC